MQRTEIEGSYKNRLLVKGEVGIDRDEMVIYKSITRPGLWSGYNLKAFLNRNGILVNGEVRKGIAQGRKLAYVESDPVSVSVTNMMKFSNNYISGMLTKHLSLQRSKVGNMRDGLAVLSQTLSELGFKDFVMESSSGLSRHNKFRPMDMSRLLDIAFADFTLFPEFMSSLPVSGVDGTLKERLQSKSNWIRAKTGLLTGVVGLARICRLKKRPHQELCVHIQWGEKGDDRGQRFV